MTTSVDPAEQWDTTGAASARTPDTTDTPTPQAAAIADHETREQFGPHREEENRHA